MKTSSIQARHCAVRVIAFAALCALLSAPTLAATTADAYFGPS